MTRSSMITMGMGNNRTAYLSSRINKKVSRRAVYTLFSYFQYFVFQKVVLVIWRLITYFQAGFRVI